MKNLLIQIQSFKTIFSITFILKIIVFLVVAIFVKSLIFRLLRFVDEKFLKSRLNSSGIFGIFNISFPLLMVFLFVQFTLLKNDVFALIFVCTLLFIFSVLLVRSLVPVISLSPLFWSGTLRTGRIIELNGSRSEIVKFGLFHITTKGTDGSIDVLPTSELVKTSFSIPLSESEEALEIEVPFEKEIETHIMDTLRRILITKPYIDKEGRIDIDANGKQLHVKLYLLKKSYEQYARQDLKKTCRQMLML